MISYNTVLVSGTSDQVITKDEIKLYLRLPSSSSEDTLLDNLISTAENYVEEHTNCTLLNKVYDVYFEGFSSPIILPNNPVSSVEHVKYYDTDDTEYTLATSVYDTDFTKLFAEIDLKYNQTYPTTTLRTMKPIIIRFKAGYGETTSSVPEMLKIVIRLVVSDMYENRVMQIPIKLYENPTVDNLLGPYKRERMI